MDAGSAEYDFTKEDTEIKIKVEKGSEVSEQNSPEYSADEDANGGWKQKEKDMEAVRADLEKVDRKQKEAEVAKKAAAKEKEIKENEERAKRDQRARLETERQERVKAEDEKATRIRYR